LRKSTLDIEQRLTSEFEYRKDFMTKIFSKLNGRLRSTSFPSEVYTNLYYVDATPVCDDSNLQCFIDEVHLTKDGKKLLVTYIVNAAQKEGFAIN
jgi:hypothetical protein